jgi:calcineurin-like phosphoesterase family protein
MNRLNGYKYLVMGNHDRHSVSWWGDVGFNKVYKKQVEINNAILTHTPIIVPHNKINIHGHIHNTPLNEKFNPNNHLCVSVEKINYTPIEINFIINSKNTSIYTV